MLRRSWGTSRFHVYGGYTVTPHYDSMICKLITYGRTRKIALDRMYRALSEYLIRGIDTNIEFVKAVILDQPLGKVKLPHPMLKIFWPEHRKNCLKNPIMMESKNEQKKER